MKPWIPVEHRNNLPPVDQWVILKIDKRVNPQDYTWHWMMGVIGNHGSVLEEVTVGKLWYVSDDGISVWRQSSLGHSLDNVVEWQELPDLSLYHRAVEPWSIYDTTYETYEAVKQGVLQ